MSEVVQQDYRFLKAIVAAMGLVLVIGFAVVVATLIKRAGTKTAAPRESTVALPAGAQVVDTTIAGGVIVLRVANGAQETLIILDGKTGTETGRVHLVNADAASH